MNKSTARSGMDRPLRKPEPVQYRRWLLIAGGILVGLMACIWLYVVVAQQMHRVTVDADALVRFPVEAYSLSEVAGAIATIQSSRIAYVDSVSHGIVEAILVEQGQRVEAGQVLVTLGNPEVILDAAAKEADVVQQINNLLITELTLTQTITNRRQELERLSTNISQHQTRLKRLRELHASGAVSQEALELAEDDVTLATRMHAESTRAYAAENRLAMDRLSALRNTVQRLEAVSTLSAAAVDGLSVRSPATGTLGELNIELGQMIGRGDNVGRVDLDGDYYAKATVDEFFASSLTIGGIGVLSLNHEREVELIIRKIATAIKDGKVEVELTFLEGHGETSLKPGQTFPLRIELSRQQTVPAIHVQDAHTFRSGGRYFVLSGDTRHAERREINFGQRVGSTLEILSGAQLGETVIETKYPLGSDVTSIRWKE